MWKEHSTLNYSRITLYNLVKNVKATESGKRQKWSGRPAGATTEPIADGRELQHCSQEETPATHFPKIIFVGEKDLKVNWIFYLEHSENKIIPSLEIFKKDFIFFTLDSAPSHDAR